MIPKFNDLPEIAEQLALIDEKYSIQDATIVFTVSKEALKRLNDDFYYRNYETGTPDDDADEINLTVGGFKFKYTIE